MCGIGGYSGRFDRGLLGHMNALLAHRGPDDAGDWADPASAIGLTHRRLSIIDLSQAGHQPMVSNDAGLVITYNGEIYNYRALARELKATGHEMRSQSDTEVLLHLYEEHGVEMLGRLNGIYAFALWDAGRHQLFLARDGVGVKPLYYAETEKGFLFASEIKALLADRALSRELDLVALEQHLTFLWAIAPRTILKHVRKLEPGYAMLVQDGRIRRKWQHYDLPYNGERLDLPETELVEELRERLKQAVDRQMVSDVPVGAFLSGGLDSSTVVAMMKLARPDYRPVCYSIGFADAGDLDGSPSDLPYARKAAAALDVDLRPIVIGPEIISNLERMLYHLDEPQADPAPINALLIAEQARADGTKVLLSGAGGDDIFSGYRRHVALRLRRYWGWMPPRMRGALARWANSAGGRSPAARRIRRGLSHGDLDGDEWAASLFTWSTHEVRRGLLSADVAQSLGGVDPLDPMRDSLRKIPGEHDSLNRMLYLEGKHFLADHNLNYTDKMGMAAGVENRVPLLDPDLIDFAAKIPPGLKQRGRTGKYILKRAAEPFLPSDVIYRPKTGFGAPLRRWMHNELKELTEDVLSPGSLSRRGLFQPEAIRDLIERDRSGRTDAAYLIFAVMCVELWCRMFVDREPEAI